MAQSALKNIRASGIRAINLDEGDELIAVIPTTGDDTVIIATRNGMATGFHESNVRPMGRTAVGVRGIRLREGDYVIGAGCTSEGSDVLTVTEMPLRKSPSSTTTATVPRSSPLPMTSIRRKAACMRRALRQP